MKAIWKAGSGKKRKEGALQERGNTTLGELLEERDKNWREMKVKAQDGKEWRKS